MLQPGWLNRATAAWPFTDDWPAFFLDLALFLYGFLIYSSARLRASVRAVAFLALALSVVCLGAVVLLITLGRTPGPDYSAATLLYLLAQTFSVWLLALALLGLAMRYLTVSTAWQRYLTAAAFPVFVLHGPLLAASAYYLTRIPAPRAVQFLLILTVTVVGTFGFYEYVYVARRTPVTRFLFGVKAPHAEDRAP